MDLVSFDFFFPLSAISSHKGSGNLDVTLDDCITEIIRDGLSDNGEHRAIYFEAPYRICGPEIFQPEKDCYGEVAKYSVDRYIASAGQFYEILPVVEGLKKAGFINGFTIQHETEGFLFAHRETPFRKAREFFETGSPFVVNSELNRLISEA